jgi:hypothetical protein
MIFLFLASNANLSIFYLVFISIMNNEGDIAWDYIRIKKYLNCLIVYY